MAVHVSSTVRMQIGESPGPVVSPSFYCPSTEYNFPVLPSTTLFYKALYYLTLPFPVLPLYTLYYRALYYPALPFPGLRVLSTLGHGEPWAMGSHGPGGKKWILGRSLLWPVLGC